MRTLHPRARVIEAFRRTYGAKPEFLVRAPGRVNLIGEHIDYNGGHVLPMAIDFGIWIALRPRPDDQVHVMSLDFEDSDVFILSDLEKGEPGWIEYLKGVAWALQASGRRLCGWEGTIAGNVPIGAGLSSSAALEIATM